ncbi:hypothetical protein C1645_748636 [Glomus cerebriforme]|uniref:Uncharacterized protein n=1 Tax=Glomus cerebriforme TaxID=658196 RepID=A0A397TKT5_9GLOM|nr:hypothetical protein C1645_748636 [Glomus cerebriforme]
MISRRFSLLSMIVLICMILIGLTQTAPLNKRQEVAAFADFNTGILNKKRSNSVVGLFTFSNTPDNKCRVIGQFYDGLESPNIKDYTLQIVKMNGDLVFDLTKTFTNGKVSVHMSGTTSYQHNFNLNELSLETVMDNLMIVKNKDNKIGETLIESLK